MKKETKKDLIGAINFFAAYFSGMLIGVLIGFIMGYILGESANLATLRYFTEFIK